MTFGDVSPSSQMAVEYLSIVDATPRVPTSYSCDRSVGTPETEEAEPPRMYAPGDPLAR